MRQEASVELFQYWNRLRDGRSAPRRTEIEPADIKSLLADTFILEKSDSVTTAFRLAGTRLCAIYGRELKGFDFASLWRERDQKLLRRLISGMFIDKTIVVINYDGTSANGRTMSFEMIILPLESGDGSSRCIGLVTPTERAYWLGADRIADAHVTAMRVFDPSRDPLFLKTRPEVEVPEVAPRMAPPALAMPPSQASRRVHHLIVLNGGRTD